MMLMALEVRNSNQREQRSPPADNNRTRRISAVVRRPRWRMYFERAQCVVHKTEEVRPWLVLLVMLMNDGCERSIDRRGF